MMKKIFSFFTLQLIILGSLTAQNFVNKINPYPIESPKKLTATDTLKILAVMVDFQQDNDPTTFGNGKFGSVYSEDYGNSIIDPLPFDKNYFENHLTFAKNYFSKVSGGIANITFTIVPDVITVSKTIRNYSPEIQSSDLTNVANLAKETWELTDQFDYDFSEYDLFAIFHAGVGRDISLPGSIGNERDIPSVYLSQNSLKNIFGNDFTGFNSNGKSISNTMIIPSTESRELEGIGGSVLIELSTNGLIVASIASHLGLPDLFDTETGKSAIGRFGLMDGQAIFGYGGLFPPQLSAWEKIYLGWETPEVISSGNVTLDIAASLANSNSTKIYKIPLTSSEYYLVENRQRDVNSNGSIITYFSNGESKTINFEKDTTGFQSYDISDLQGVITDVDEYDWALPGNGIVIWHIDEKIITAKLSTNSINSDKTMRGVDVEEADGIQDIGEEFYTIFGDIVIGEGSDQDLWYSGNKAELYENKFDANTKPNTNTNSGASSLISFTNFSASENIMSFNLSFSENDVDLIISDNQNHSLVFDVNTSTIVGLKGNTLYETPISSQLPTIFAKIDNFSSEDLKPAKLILGNDKFYFGAFNDKLNVLKKGEGGLLKTQTLNSFSVSPPLIAKEINSDVVFIATQNEQVESFLFNPNSSEILTNRNIVNVGKNISQIIYLNGLFIAAENELISENTFVGNHTFSSNVKHISASINNKNEYITAILLENSSFVVLRNNQIISEFTPINKGEVKSFVLADLINSGENQIVFSSENNLFITSIDGASIENFPYQTENKLNEFINIIDLQNDGYSEILFYDELGNIYLVSTKDGKLNNSFPISIGQSFLQNPILISNNNEPALFVIGDQADYRIFSMKFPNNYTIIYGEEFGNGSNNAVVEAAGNSNQITEYFPSTKAYNWPNPVYENETYIRFYVSEDSDAEVKIFDLAGDLVDELSGFAIGGLENELTWNVQNIQSGVYFANLEVKSANSKSANKIIKIAVIK